MKPLHLGLAGAAALALLIVPWLRFPRLMAVPAEFGPGEPVYGVLVRLAREVDRVCRDGDVAGVESYITPEFHSELAHRLAGTGKTVTAQSLGDTKALIGELRDADFRIGRARADRAVLVFRQRGYGLRARDFLFGVVFWWDGYRFLVHRTSSRVLDPLGDSEPRGAAELAADLLESRHRQR